MLFLGKRVGRLDGAATSDDSEARVRVHVVLGAQLGVVRHPTVDGAEDEGVAVADFTRVRGPDEALPLQRGRRQVGLGRKHLAVRAPVGVKHDDPQRPAVRADLVLEHRGRQVADERSQPVALHPGKQPRAGDSSPQGRLFRKCSRVPTSDQGRRRQQRSRRPRGRTSAAPPSPPPQHRKRWTTTRRGECVRTDGRPTLWC